MVLSARDARFDARSNFRNLSGQRDYKTHRVYVGDTCVLKTNPQRVGHVTQTQADIDSHADSPLLLEQDISHAQIAPPIFNQYLSRGIPPTGTAMVSWLPSTSADAGGTIHQYELIPESTIESVDRELCIGDVVRLNPDDAASGVVIDVRARANLRSPQKWQTLASNTIYDVLISDLVDSKDLDLDHIIYLDGWIGRILDYEEKIKVRLSDGSIIQLDDPEDVTTVGGHPASDTIVGDVIKTKKSNLRRGEAIFGHYNPNVHPVGRVVDITVDSVEVEWLQAKPLYNGHDVVPAMPPAVLDRTDLDRAFIYGSQEHEGSTERPRDINVGAGDAVRLRCPTDMLTQRGDELRLTPRSQTLGFDTNVYSIQATFTNVQVQWQDNRITEHPAIALAPTMDFDDEDEVWPGELVTTKAAHSVDGVRTPFRVGIVQSVSANARMAKVKFFDGQISFTETEDKSIMPGSSTCMLNDDAEDVSLYDIWVEPGLPRRLGDFLLIIPPFGSSDDNTNGWKDEPRYRDLRHCLEQPGDSLDWFGEITELGTNGLITLYLGASKQPRHIQVPWECTVMVYSSDLAEDEDDTSSNEHFENETSATTAGLRNPDVTPPQWTDEQGRLLDAAQVDGEEWLTDDDEQDQPMPDAAVTDSESTPLQSSADLFSYQSMFDRPSQRQSPGTALHNFKILDGVPPLDHHYGDHQVVTLDGPLLRRIQKEHRSLRSSLPPEVFVRTWESALHLLRILILGPLKTPYEYAPFVIDVMLDGTFPAQPPKLFFHSWTDNYGPVNPNLYEDGTICLSLLGTWPGDNSNDTWTSNATLLQIMVSLLGLVLTREPYFNEAGFENRAGSTESKVPSAVYSERSFLKSRRFILRALQSTVAGFEQELEVMYLQETANAPMLLARALYDGVVVICKNRSKSSSASRALDVNSAGADRVMSFGATIALERTVNELLSCMRQQAGLSRVAQRIAEILQCTQLDSIPLLDDILWRSSAAFTGSRDLDDAAE